jgi:hypothetical protein
VLEVAAALAGAPVAAVGVVAASAMSASDLGWWGDEPVLGGGDVGVGGQAGGGGGEGAARC